MSALPPKQAFTDCDLDSVRVSAFGHKQTFKLALILMPSLEKLFFITAIVANDDFRTPDPFAPRLVRFTERIWIC